ncbi:MAG: DNA-binding protein [Thermoproteota archaeon]
MSYSNKYRRRFEAFRSQAEPQESPIYLISIKPVYAHQIFQGTKKYELRRNARIEPGSTMVVYVSGHVRAVVGEFDVGRVIEGSPQEVWSAVTKSSGHGIGRDAWRYIKNGRTAVALEVASRRLYPRRVTLEEIRRIIPGWMPPMSYKRLYEGDPFYELIVKRLRMLIGR